MPRVRKKASNISVKTTSVEAEEKEVKQVTVKPESEKIWEEIQDKEINMFSLPNQKIKDHLDPLDIPADRLYAKHRSQAAVSVIAETLGKEYEVDQTDKGYVIVKRASGIPAVVEEKMQELKDRKEEALELARAQRIKK